MSTKTKKDDIADFCRLMIKINSKQKGNWRIGQIIGNALKESKTDTDPFYVENEKLLEGLNNLL
jgi:hypothetical protein